MVGVHQSGFDMSKAPPLEQALPSNNTWLAYMLWADAEPPVCGSLCCCTTMSSSTPST
ncbi:hypothetical protein DNTS_025628, partial [Danionella cerebrum]